MDFETRVGLLKPLITLNNPSDDFFVVRILQRRKDIPSLENSVKQIKTYTFFNWDEFDAQSARIVELCDLNNARAYIRLNSQSAMNVSLRCIEEISRNIRENVCYKNRTVWDSVSGQLGRKDFWFIDIDDCHLDFKLNSENPITEELMRALIQHYTERHVRNKISSKSFHEEFPIVLNPTKNGAHLICRPFDTRLLNDINKQLQKEGIPLLQIQKDANTLLYASR